MVTRFPIVKLLRAGRLDYVAALRLQKLVQSGLLEPAEPSSPIKHTLILVEHDPVYTLGLRERLDPGETARLSSTGASVIPSDRGGLTTFHGPGQLVAYPIIHLSHFHKLSLRDYVSKLELVAVHACRLLGVPAQVSGSDVSHTGAWANDHKICAIGVHCKRYTTTHGLALNCNIDLSWFDHIVPCGIRDKGVTSLSHQLDEECTISEAESPLLTSFENIFSCQMQPMDDSEVEKLLNKAKEIPSYIQHFFLQQFTFNLFSQRLESVGNIVAFVCS